MFKPKYCIICNVVFIPTYPTIIFCSNECRRLGNAKRERKRHSQQYSREQNKTQYRAANPLNNFICKWCNKEFQAGGTKRKYCSKKCSADFQNNKKLVGVVFEQKSCQECNKAFTPTSANHWKDQIFCSRKCLTKNTNRIRNHVRRSKMRGVTYENINPLVIHLRDRYRCKLRIHPKCKGKSDPRKMGTSHPQAPEMDHIRPLSLGGENIMKNLQSSCRACNQRKGNKPIGQLRIL